MQKRLVVAGMALLLIIAAGLVASQMLVQRVSGSGTVAGHTWEYASTFQGEVTCLNPDGSISEVGRGMLQGDPSKGEVDLKVDGQEYTFGGVGKHEVLDSSGKLLGYVDMKPAPSEEELEAQRKNSIGAVNGTEFGVEGWDKVLGISWEMRGRGRVTVKVPDGVEAGLHGSTVEQCKPDLPDVPKLTVKAQSGTFTKSGYGIYAIAGEGGKTVMTITIEPCSSQQ